MQCHLVICGKDRKEICICQLLNRYVVQHDIELLVEDHLMGDLNFHHNLGSVALIELVAFNISSTS